MNISRKKKAESIRRLLETESDQLKQNVGYLNQERYRAIERFGEYDVYRDKVRSIKEKAIDKLPDLIDRVNESVESNGGTVHLAQDEDEAREFIEKLLSEHNANTIVKSKSMTTEEINLNEHLKNWGKEVWETDLGELVIQLANESASHLVAPSVHKSKQKIASLFNEYFDLDEPLMTPQELTKFARNFLGNKVNEADVGVTGANFILADSGTIVLVTNEGNARKCAVSPDVHLAVAGIEKLIPSINELEPFIHLISRAANGQDITRYLSLLSPPQSTPTVDFQSSTKESLDPSSRRDFYLLLIDNGRWEMREDEQLRETLYCIRCGACANSCANFQNVGGHAFGGETYSGGIGTGWEAGINGPESTAEFGDLCTGCSRCVNQCPVKIDIPWINTVVRDRLNRNDSPSNFDSLVQPLIPDEESAGIDLQKRFFGNFSNLAKIGSLTAPVSNWIKDTVPIRRLLEWAFGVDRRRKLPTFHRQTLISWFQNRSEVPGRSQKEVVLYPDLYTNFLGPERGKAAVRVLESYGWKVNVPQLPSSGRAPLSQGMIKTASREAKSLWNALEERVKEDCPIIVLEPSDLSMFRRDYEKLISEENFQKLKQSSFEIMEFLQMQHSGLDTVPSQLTRGNEARIAYHSHCQQRTEKLESYTIEFLESLGYTIHTSDVECCGMAGSFGYKEEYFELSMAVGEELKDQLEPEAGNTLIAASGTSCQEQLEALLNQPVYHPIEVIDPSRNNPQ